MFTGKPWEIAEVASGDAGIRQTARRMQELVKEAVRDGRVVNFAQEVTRPAGPTQGEAVLRLIVDFVRSRWVFRRDPIGVELLKTPERLLTEAAQHGSMLGDCDDASVLTAALCAAVGIPTSFVIIQRDARSRSFDHVYVEAWDGSRWLALDSVALGRPLFFRPPNLPGRIERFSNG